jgi:hypothetical protein
MIANPQDAYDEGKRSQNEIIASKPDVGDEQWIARGRALRAEMQAALAEVERIRGRMDAIGRHLMRRRGAS